MFDFLFRKTDATSLCLFRMVFGLLGFLDVLNIYAYYHWKMKAFQSDRFQFNYLGFEWVDVFPEPFMSIIFIVIMLSALGVMIGYQYRWASLVFAIGFTYLFLLEKAHYLNHGYLFCWLSWVMAGLPANVMMSLDARQKRVAYADYIPYWPLFILQFLMGVVYFYGGIAKINPDWLNGIPLKMWLAREGDVPIIGPVLVKEATAYFMSYGGLLFDLSVTFLLLFKSTRTYIFLVGLFFHGLNAIIFNIGIFPYLSIALTALYFPAVLYRDRLGQLLKWNQPNLEKTFPANKMIVFVLIPIMLFHLLMPLRHHLMRGQVAWNEAGHRYSWRMMLRSKWGSGQFIVKDLETKEKIYVKPETYLGPKQVRKMYTHPDMIWQFAQYLKEQYEKEGRKVSIHADIKVQLNNEKRQHFIDPSVDLAREKWHFYRAADWIEPLKRN